MTQPLTSIKPTYYITVRTSEGEIITTPEYSLDSVYRWLRDNGGVVLHGYAINNENNYIEINIDWLNCSQSY